MDDTNINIKYMEKWGYSRDNGKKYIVNYLEIYFRKDTSDPKIIDEVLTRNVYQKQKIGFVIDKNDVWLDLGGNIGAFSLLVMSFGGIVIVLEPEPENIEMININLEHNFPDRMDYYEILPYAVDLDNGEKELYLCKGEYNKSRHTLYPKKNREHITVNTITIEELLKLYPRINSIKMDIEGSEIDILENTDFSLYPQIKKLVFEYSFDIDPSIPRFIEIINNLKNCFTTVHYTKVNPNDLEYKYYPPCTNVFCLR